MSITVHLDRVSGPSLSSTVPERSGLARASAPRVLMATRYGRLGASSRLRLLQYAEPLARAGIICTARPFLSDQYVTALYEGRSRLPAVLAAYTRALGLRAAVQDHDIVWIEKEMLPFLPAMFERAILGPNKKFILDFDDAWFLRYGGQGNRAVRALLGGKFPALLRRAALTVVANETLRDWAMDAGAGDVLLLPTVVDLDHYPMTPAPDGRVFTAGWIGTPVTSPYLARLAEPLRQLAVEGPVELLVIGAPDFTIEGVACRHLPWSEATEAAMIGQMDVGIMPLPDDAWARGKSGYKLIQYMAAGRPTIGSPVGANTAIVQDGVTGFLATTPAEWADRLRRLRDNVPLRQAMGTAARERVAAQFSLQATAPKLAAAIRAIAAR
ncbi:MAG: glycosyltransferase family 4 protein [Acidiphilium sp.]|nr:glycosyltransferase family 4 protein [Acidiphilium sp.]MDD4937011.1 glycosyltransferase family 4 protein [Acidiphilium sp.]